MKSFVSNLLELATCVLYDAVAKCTDVTLDVRDLITLKSRVKHEGISFLTISLPTLGQELERALANGKIDSTQFRSFRKRGKAPAFLQGFFSLVFDEEGRVYDEPSISAVEGLRQIAYTFKKLEVPCAPRRVQKALTKFKMDEQLFLEPLVPGDVDDFISVSRVLWDSVLWRRIDLYRDVKPRHGPGATAEKVCGNAKFLGGVWHDRLETYFPVLDTVFTSVNAMSGQDFERVSIVDSDGELPVRITPVPKTLKGPRIIAIEPCCMQYTQQALAKYLINMLGVSRLTKGHINFNDQTINRKLALHSSKDQRFATLDLSSASDLVPYELAMRMFDCDPDLRDAISACRSTKAQMPDGEVIPLKKFASMGSALCFPVEAMYFYTICVIARLRKHNLPSTYRNVMNMTRKVYVYGDDIIVPTDESAVVSSTLQKYYCRVNTNKSFSSGKFRESCGMDAYAGYEVTPTYIRQTPPRNKQDAASLISWTASSNLFYKRGYWRTSSALLKRVESIIGSLPIVGDKCAGLGKISFQRRVPVERWNKALQRPEVRTWVPSPVYSDDPLDDYPALTKCLLALEDAPDQSAGDPKDARHLERTARHGAVALKRRWTFPW